MLDLKKAPSGTRRPWGMANLQKVWKLAPKSVVWASFLPSWAHRLRNMESLNLLDTSSQEAINNYHHAFLNTWRLSRGTNTLYTSFFTVNTQSPVLSCQRFPDSGLLVHSSVFLVTIQLSEKPSFFLGASSTSGPCWTFFLEESIGLLYLPSLTETTLVFFSSFNCPLLSSHQE